MATAKHLVEPYKNGRIICHKSTWSRSMTIPSTTHTPIRIENICAQFSTSLTPNDYVTKSRHKIDTGVTKDAPTDFNPSWRSLTQTTELLYAQLFHFYHSIRFADTSFACNCPCNTARQWNNRQVVQQASLKMTNLQLRQKWYANMKYGKCDQLRHA